MWDVDVTESVLRERLRHPDPRIRAPWQGHLLREAHFRDVWRHLSLEEVVRDWAYLEEHLGKRRAFWTALLRGWREDGLIPA